MKKLFVFLSILLVSLSLSTVALANNNEIPQDLLDNSLHFREQLGFKTDLEIISGIYNSKKDQVHNLRYGALLSDQEVEELNERIHIMTKGKEIRKDYLRKYLNDIFGGMYFDHIDQGGVLKIGIVNLNKNLHIKEETIKKLNIVDKSRIQFFDAKFSVEELAKAQENMINFLLENKITDFFTQPSLKENNIEVYISRSDEGIINNIKNQFNSELYDVIVQDGLIYNKTNRRDTYEPLWAGINITAGGNRCTSAYIAKKDSNYFLLTAGHCFDLDETVSQGNRNIGTVDDVLDTNYVDVLAIGIDSSDASAYLYDDSPGTFNNRLTVEGWEGASDDMVGDPVCFSGVTTDDVKCGTIYAIGLNGDGLRTATFSVSGGDSGSPVYNPHYLTTEAYAKGIVAASILGGSMTVYSHIGIALDALDLDSIVIE